MPRLPAELQHDGKLFARQDKVRLTRLVPAQTEQPPLQLRGIGLERARNIETERDGEGNDERVELALLAPQQRLVRRVRLQSTPVTSQRERL